MRFATCIVFLFLQPWLLTGTVASPTPAKRYAINLDLPPQYRWKEIVDEYGWEFPILLKEFERQVPPAVIKMASLIGLEVEKYIPYPYNLEMVGIATGSGMTVGEIVLANVFYEATAFGSKDGRKACTSIVAESEDGTIYHGRNLDYSFSDVLRNLTIIVDFQRNGTTVYSGTTFAGYVGLLSAQKPNSFTVSLDERDQGEWWMNVIEVLLAGTHGIASFVIRDTAADPNADFEKAVKILAYNPLIAPSYIIVGGVGPKKGAVITRDRLAALDIWWLDAGKGRWFLVETNYDHWLPPPASDDRRDPAIKAMNKLGRAHVGISPLFDVLSTPPVLNDGTLYTTVMSAGNPELLKTWVRHPSKN